jgi:hypothetical protein
MEDLRLRDAIKYPQNTAQEKELAEQDLYVDPA